MPGHKCVILALIRVREAAQPIETTIGRKPVTPPGQKLVAVSLMAYIPYDTVIRGMEHIM